MLLIFVVVVLFVFLFFFFRPPRRENSLALLSASRGIGNGWVENTPLLAGARDSPGNEKKRDLNENVYGGSCGLGSVSLILSRIPIGAFFREVHPGLEMASQNDQNKAK